MRTAEHLTETEQVLPGGCPAFRQGHRSSSPETQGSRQLSLRRVPETGKGRRCRADYTRISTPALEEGPPTAAATPISGAGGAFRKAVVSRTSCRRRSPAWGWMRRTCDRPGAMGRGRFQDPAESPAFLRYSAKAFSGMR